MYKDKKIVLDNGIAIVYAGHSAAYSMCLSVNIGHVNEPKLGLAALFEKVLLLQTEGIVPIFGGTMTAYLTGGKDIKVVLAKISQLVCDTVANEDFVERAKSLIAKETKNRAPLIDRQMRLMYKHTAFGADLVKSTDEYLAALASYTVDDVKEFANKYYSGANSVLMVAGPGFPEKTLKTLGDKYFANLPKGKAQPRFKGDLYTGGFNRVEVDRTYFGTRIMLGWDLGCLSLQDSPAANVMMSMFRARLERALFEAGINGRCSIEWKIAGYYGLRTMRLYLSSPSVSPKRLVDVTTAVIRRLCATEASDVRMEKSRSSAAVEKLYKFEKSDDKALEMAWQIIGRGSTYSLDDRISGIYDVTAHDVKLIARQVFLNKKRRPTYVIAVPKNTEFYAYDDVLGLLYKDMR